MSPPVLELRSVTKTYLMGEVDVPVLRGVDIALALGEYVVLLGPSGSGKSTILQLLGGLDRPSSGAVLHRGSDIAHASDGELTEYRRRHVGFVFQAYDLIPSLTALENVELVTEIVESPMPAREALDLVGLGHREGHFPSQLSGGEQQRVAIARALAKRPDLLLCDEPTGALDLATGVAVLEVLEHVNRSFNTTLLVVTHSTALADLADRVLHVADGLVRSSLRNERRRSPREVAW